MYRLNVSGYMAVLLLLLPAVSTAQIHIAPPAIYLSDIQPSGRIEVLNTGRQPVDVTVDLGYGYPRTNSDGQLYMDLLEKVPANEPSAAEWIQIYPYRFTLSPGLRQTIRFAVFAPDTPSRREYWARPIVSSRVRPPTSELKSESVEARLDVVQRSILALNYRHGSVHTAPSLDSTTIRQNNGYLEIESFIRQTGTAAVLGNIIVELSDPENGTLIERKERKIAVYHRLNRIIRWPIKDLTAPSYRVSVEINSDRKGPNPGDIIPFESIRHSQTFDLTERDG